MDCEKLSVLVLMFFCTGCAFPLGVAGSFAAGAVGAAVTPIVQPQIDRVLHALGMDWIDPAGAAAVAAYDNTTVTVITGPADKKE